MKNNNVKISDVLKVKDYIRRLYENIEEITIEYKSTHPRVNVKDVKVKITGVYRNFFTFKENKSHIVVEHTVMYVDIITGNFKICSDNQNI